MRIVDIEAYEVAIPFRAPILSSFGVSYPARVRTFIRLHTDEGLVGIGETGPSATHPFVRGAQVERFARIVKPQVIDEDVADHRLLARKLYHAPEAIAVEMACWDVLAQAAGVPLYRLLGGHGRVDRVPVSGYAFFRLPGRDGGGAVTLDSMADHCRAMVDQFGFDVIKVKLGAHEPGGEIETLRQVRDALGGAVALRADPNGAWSLPTALRALKSLDAVDLEYIEEPIRILGKGDQAVDVAGLRRLRELGSTPVAADHAYQADLLAHIIRGEAADVALADLYGCGGVAATVHFARTAATFGLGVALHSGTELGVGQIAKLHVHAALPLEIRLAGDAIYPEYVDDVLEGGPIVVSDGKMAVPQAPGLGARLDDGKLAHWELTSSVKRDLDEYWADLKSVIGVDYPSADLLVRHY